MIGETVRPQNEMSLCLCVPIDTAGVRFRYFQPELQFFLRVTSPAKEFWRFVQRFS